MSSKNAKDKAETVISIDTTILKINVKTTGDLITKEYDLIPFHPNMADLRDLSNNSYILFPSFVKITMKDLKKAGVGSDYPKVFMNLDKYVKLIKYVTSPDKDEEDNTLLIDKSQAKNYTTSLAQNALSDLMADTSSDVLAIQKTEPLTKDDIITNNIQLIKSLFFPSKGRFYILGNEYIIGQSKYIPPYTPSQEENKKLLEETKEKIPLAYTVKFELQLLDAVNNPDAGDFMKMNCKAKKTNITKDMDSIFGTKLSSDIEKKVMTPSILNTTKPTQSRQFGKLQKEWEERNKYVKAPANEQERKKMEANWTTLQKKMAVFEKSQVAYDKIPPQWLLETDVLDNKYLDFKKAMLKLWKDMSDIYESNKEETSFRKDMLDAIKTKMYAAVQDLNVKKQIIDEPAIAANRAKAENLTAALFPLKEETKKREMLKKEKYSKELEDALLEYDKLKHEFEAKKVEFTQNPIELKNINKNYTLELNGVAEKIVNLKEIDDSLIKKMEALNRKEKEKEVDALLDAASNEFLKKAKEAAQKMIDEKYLDIIQKDAGLGEKQKDIEALVTKEKELIAQRAASDDYTAAAVNAEIAKVQAQLRKKTAEKEVMSHKYSTMVQGWKDTKKTIKTAAESIATEKSKEEKLLKNKTVKEDLDKLMKNYKEMNEEYLLAKFKTGDDKFLTKEDKSKFEKKDRPLDSVDTIKANLTTLKDEYMIEAEKLGILNKIQAEQTFINDELKYLTKARDDKVSAKADKDKLIKSNATELSSYSTGTNQAEIDKKQLANKVRIDALNADQAVLQKELKKITEPLDSIKDKITLYTEYVKNLKGIKDDDQAKANFDSLKKKFEDDEKNVKVIVGGSGTRKHHHKHKYTKRFSVAKMNKTLRKLRRLMRQRRHTMRQT
jgi:hypothetical protein